MAPHLGHARFLIAAGRLRAAGGTIKADLLRAEWESVNAVKEKHEARLRRLYASLLRQQRRAVLDALPTLFASAGGAQAKRKDPGALRVGQMLLNFSDWLDGIEAIFGPVLASVVRAGFQTGAVRVGNDALEVRVTPYAQRSLDLVVTKIKGTTATTQYDVGRIVRAGMEAQASKREISRALSAAFETWTDTRARAVAETSTVATFEAGQIEAFREADVDARRWLSQRDGNARPAHDAADGQEAGLEEPFIVDGERLMFPGDPNGSAGNVINCRCTTLPIVRPKASSWRDERNRRIVDDYPELRKAHGQAEALGMLATRENLSERQIRRVLWE